MTEEQMKKFEKWWESDYSENEAVSNDYKRNLATPMNQLRKV